MRLADYPKINISDVCVKVNDGLKYTLQAITRNEPNELENLKRAYQTLIFPYTSNTKG